jgi:hypothetical protein
MKKTYLFILEDDGHRIATFLLGVHGKTVEELIAKAEREYPGKTYLQGDDSYFNEFAAGKIYVDGQFIDPPPYVPPLDDVKTAKISELKGIRDAKEVEPIQTDKGIFDYDDKSRDRLAIARQALTDAGGTGTIMWTTADNQRVALGVADFAAINGAAAVRSNSLHVLYNELKEQVNACETVEEVEAIHWPEE